MTNDAIWSILLLFLGLLIIIVECVVPSAGLLAIAALAAVLTSMVLAFKSSVMFGFSMLTAAMLAVPITIGAVLRVLPFTPIGKRLMQPPPPPEADQRTREQESLVGKIGIAQTELIPAGMIAVLGKRYEAIAPGIVVPKGTHVEITRVSGNAIYVMPTQRAISLIDEGRTADVSSRPLAELGLEELNESL